MPILHLTPGEDRFSIQPRPRGPRLTDATLELNGITGFRWDPAARAADKPLATPLGERAGCEAATLPHAGWRLVLQAAEGPGDAILLRLRIQNTAAAPARIRRFSVIRDGHVATGGVAHDSMRTLDGLSGAGDTRVMTGCERGSSNNLLVAWKATGEAWDRALVAGGLTSADFAKHVASAPAGDGFTLNLHAEDPFGRLVEPGEVWEADDWFYLDAGAASPFAALEQYARTVRAANRASPNPYFFPTVCAWYASTPMYGGLAFMNDTPGTVREVEAARDAGFLRYAPVAVRLVPDTYDGTSSKHRNPADAGLISGSMQWSKDRNTEQGWWDDEHWHRFGHYAEPCETSRKWAQAVRERGGIPLTYMQVGHVSHDYAKAHPGHMLGNDISQLDRIFIGHHPYVTYDYTDAGFIAHMRGVWRNLAEAGVAGLMFDYPDQGWIEQGGFEDPKATTTSAYLNIFRLAREGLGPAALIHERNVARKVPYLDATVGLADSQRVWCDTDAVDPAMYRMCGLRWYKTRTLYAYDTDAKNLNKIAASSRDRLRQVLTLLYLLTGRLLLANSFTAMTREVIADLSRIYPHHPEPLSPRPVDLFESLDNPRLYALALNDRDTHAILYNPDPAAPARISPRLFAEPERGGIGLDPGQAYHAHDFWNQAYLGCVTADAPFSQQLRPAEARVIVFRRAAAHPQVIATDRHVLQGHIELEAVGWQPGTATLGGTARLIADETLTLTLALNRFPGQPVAEAPAGVSVECLPDQPAGLLRVRLHSAQTGPVRWSLRMEPR